MANAYTNTVGVLRGNGDGTFQVPLISDAIDPQELVVADLNGDTKADVVALDGGGYTVMLGNGDGTFQPPQAAFLPPQMPPGYTGWEPLAQSPGRMAVGDLDADGKVDLIAAGRTEYAVFIALHPETCEPIYVYIPNGYVNVLPGHGDGTFGPATTYHADAASGIALADFNGDGKPDVATSSAVLLGNGDGTLQSALPADVGIGGIFNQVGDFNGDGTLDVLTYTGYAGVVMLGNGDGTFRRGEDVPIGSAFDSIAVGDVNADGARDVVVIRNEYGEPTNPVSIRSATVLLGLGDGSFAPPIVSDLGPLAGVQLASAVLEDFDGDGSPDLAAADYYGGGVAVAHNDGSWTFPPPPPPPTVRIGDVTVTEGNSGSTIAAFTVTLSATWGETVTVDYATADGTATAGGDYQAQSGTLTFAPGQTSKTITVAVTGDGLAEPTETFSVSLTGATNAAIAVQQGNGTILDDEPRVSITDVARGEGNTGQTPFAFTVTLSTAYDLPVTVDFSTADGSATVGTDYQAQSGTLTFARGETSKTVTLLVIGDRLPEPDKTFFVNLGNLNYGSIADGQGRGTILDDEPRISIGGVTKAEGRKNQTTLLTFTVTLSAAYDQPVTMSYTTADGTATSGDGDYIARTGTLTFNPGETTKTITIEVKGDSKREANEVFYLDLFGLSGNALFTKNRGLGTILNDD